MAEGLYAVLEIREVVIEDRCPDVVVGKEALDPISSLYLALGSVAKYFLVIHAV